MKAGIVVTSINDCSGLLDGYLRNLAEHGRAGTRIYLIPDLKTPSFAVPGGVLCPELGTQDGFLKALDLPSDFIPRNSDNRRNVGYLMALADGADVVISIDDDNYCPEHEDFVGGHLNALKGPVLQALEVEGGWYNNLDLIVPYRYKGFARGFPYFARSRGNRGPLHKPVEGNFRVGVNAGMWIGDPDLDAMGWLHEPFEGVKAPGHVVLAPDAWCPVNSQNTAVLRELMPAYWFVRMEGSMDRFGDIFQGYFVEKVAKALGMAVRFGSPVVEHRRNRHDYLRDVECEIGAIRLLEWFLPAFTELKMTETSAIGAYLRIAGFLEKEKEPLMTMSKGMRLWAGAAGRIG